MNIIVANWKMNPNSLKEAEDLFDSIIDGVDDNVVICPPFMYLQELSERNQGSVKLGAQDMFWKDQGAYTGEVSPAMLKDAKCQYVILGHSERRKNLLETDEMVNKKVGVAIENGLIPIVCIGETEKEREEDKAEEVLEKEREIVAVIDDLVETGGTLERFAEKCKRACAKDVVALLTHGVLPIGIARTKKAYKKLYLTNTIKRKEANVDITPLLDDVLKAHARH